MSLIRRGDEYWKQKNPRRMPRDQTKNKHYEQTLSHRQMRVGT